MFRGSLRWANLHHWGMILVVAFGWIFAAIVLVGVVFCLAVGRVLFGIVTGFDPRQGVVDNLGRFVARGELSQIAVRCASSAVNMLDNISYERKARCSSVGFSVASAIKISFLWRTHLFGCAACLEDALASAATFPRVFFCPFSGGGQISHHCICARKFGYSQSTKKRLSILLQINGLFCASRCGEAQRIKDPEQLENLGRRGIYGYRQSTLSDTQNARPTRWCTMNHYEACDKSSLQTPRHFHQ